MSSIRGRLGVRVLVGFFSAIAVSGVAGEAAAFKPSTHVAAANEALEKISLVLTPGDTTLRFQIGAEILDIGVQVTEAYEAVVMNPQFFRAGAVGPDGFPDPVSGQTWGHTDQVKALFGTISSANSSIQPTRRGPMAKFEARRGPSEFRAGDVAMLLLDRFQNGGYTFRPGERAEVLAFIVGYFSHGVGDSFAHTWVNEYTIRAYSLLSGEGTYGVLTEEIQHVALETLIDSLVDKRFINAAGDTTNQQTLLDMRAPVRFLDEFFSARAPRALGLSSFGEDPVAFADYYSNLDQFNGGFLYNYFNAQADVGVAAVGASHLQPVFGLARRFKETGLISTFLDAANLPQKLVNEMTAHLPQVNLMSSLTGGYVNCYDTIGGGGTAETTDLERLRKIWRFLGTVEDRIAAHREKARVARMNWIRLAECTSQNIAKLQGAAFDPATPTLNRDACADIARLGFSDQGNPLGIDRGGVTGNTADDQEFLDELVAGFRGGDDADPNDFIETSNGHRSLVKNLERMGRYLTQAGMSMDDLANVFLPESDGDGDNIVDELDQFCRQVNDDAFKNCLNVKMVGIATVARQAQCGIDTATCLHEAQAGCRAEVNRACNSTCLGPWCDSVCGGGDPAGGCYGTCWDFGLCEDTPIGNFCLNLPGKLLCDAYCSVMSDDEDSCLDTVLPTTECIWDDAECTLENAEKTITFDNFGGQILQPLRDACKTVNDAIDELEKLKDLDDVDDICALAVAQGLTPPATCTALAALGTGLAAAAGAAAVVADATKDNPILFVNFAFIERDLKDPEYFNAFRSALNAKQNQVMSEPPSAERTAKLNTLSQFQTMLDDVESGNPARLFRFTTPADEANLIRRTFQMGLIPVVPGKTARQVLRDIGPKTSETFLPYYNAVRGTMLTPMLGKSDVDDLFTKQQLGTTLLPWNATAQFSSFCGDELSSPFCDVMKSFDDPNCIDCDQDPDEPERAAFLLPDPTANNWVPARGMTVWNDYDPSGDSPRFVTTNLPFANSELAYHRLYKRIFKVPASTPIFSGFEDEARPWTSSSGGLTTNTTRQTEGRASLGVESCNWVQIDSPLFGTAEWGVVGTKLAVDIFIPVRQQNPSWVGDIAMSIDIPRAGIFTAWLGINPLTSLPRGQWSTVEFNLPSNVREALLGDTGNARISLQLNIATCPTAAERQTGNVVSLDNLRFSGELTDRDIFHNRGSLSYTVKNGGPLGFENASDWSSPGPALTSNNDFYTEGARSLGVPISAYRNITSRSFNTSELSDVTSRMNLDVFIPRPVPNAWWYGDVSLFLTCGNVINQPIGQPQPLTYLFQQEFNSLVFDVPNNIQAVLKAPNSGCTISVALNAAPGAGTFLLDNLGFIQ